MINERNIEFFMLLGNVIKSLSSFNEERIKILIELKENRYQAILKSLDIENFNEDSFRLEISNIEFLFKKVI